MNERWVVRPKHVDGGATIWRVHDGNDAGRPVAEFAEEDAARAHATRLAEGPFDWDEQEAWQDPDDEDEDDAWGRDAADIDADLQGGAGGGGTRGTP
ncbi:MAG: hypothetical protein WEB03_16835 [Nitriliruptor sp.]|uniref:hypothetical protein n=1 Tax=Nitriliruptor sp. TaxID=2448056 RepID=UPI0034A0AA00